MNSKVSKHLDLLNSDYKSITGEAFRHFFCPVLYKDEKTELCQAHVINKAFKGSDRSWTIQRSDVDNFYGSHFEAEFEIIQEKDRHSADVVLTDKSLSRKFKPQIYVDGQRVEHYRSSCTPPEFHTPVNISEGIQIALKRSPAEMQVAHRQNWEIRYEKDLSLSSLVSLIKAAHLTLFHLLGYRHPLSMGGYFVGKTILGDFFRNTRGKSRNEVTEFAISHFKQFANMVRPALNNPLNLKGTLTDQYLNIWMYQNKPWAILVFVRTGDLLNSVAMPIMQGEEDSARYIRFLKDQSTTTETRLAKWNGDSWEIFSKPETQFWPPPRFDPKKKK